MTYHRRPVEVTHLFYGFAISIEALDDAEHTGWRIEALIGIAESNQNMK